MRGRPGFARLVDDVCDLGFDSIWLPELLTAPTLDPLTGLAFAAAHNDRVKLGTTVLLPGHNLVRLTKQLAALDRLSGGRLLVTFVPGLARQPETGAAGLTGRDRGRMMDEMLPLVRRLWAGETVSHHGETADFEGVTVAPLPGPAAARVLDGWDGTGGPSPVRSLRRRVAPLGVHTGRGGRGPGGHR